jgi:hypothetical protein
MGQSHSSSFSAFPGLVALRLTLLLIQVLPLNGSTPKAVLSMEIDLSSASEMMYSSG